MSRKTNARSARGGASGLIAELADLVQGLLNSLFDPYRPELHYMRGPGPKWHAKHDTGPELAMVPALVRVKR